MGKETRLTEPVHNHCLCLWLESHPPQQLQAFPFSQSQLRWGAVLPRCACWACTTSDISPGTSLGSFGVTEVRTLWQEGWMGGECLRGPGKLQLAKWTLLTAGVMLLQGNPGSFSCDNTVYNHHYTRNSNPCFYFCRINHPQSSCSLGYRGEQRELMELYIYQVTMEMVNS